MSGARLKIEGRQGRGFSSIAAHLPGPSHSTVVIILKPFANSDFLKKTMTIKQSSDMMFFHVMESFIRYPDIGKWVRKGDTAELLNWKKNLPMTSALRGLATSYITEMLQLYRPSRSLRTASKKLLTSWRVMAVGRSNLLYLNYGTHCQNLPAIMMILQTLSLL